MSCPPLMVSLVISNEGYVIRLLFGISSKVMHWLFNLHWLFKHYDGDGTNTTNNTVLKEIACKFHK